jgi:hypothetical protein
MVGCFELLIALAAFAAGAIASVAGFGIGSILTPLLSLELGTRLAVAAVSIPHLIATFARFWVLRGDVDRRVMLHFGILSAAGGLAGALFHSVASNPALSLVFAVLLLFAGLSGLSGYARKMRFGPGAAWVAGAVSGAFGGLLGNQGGIRSAALLGFGLAQRSFVATATAIALLVDAARMPVYFVTAGPELLPAAGLIALSTIGVLAGTFSGTTILKRIPEPLFQRTVGITILTLGCVMLVRAIQGR